MKPPSCRLNRRYQLSCHRLYILACIYICFYLLTSKAAVFLSLQKQSGWFPDHSHLWEGVILFWMSKFFNSKYYPILPFFANVNFGLSTLNTQKMNFPYCLTTLRICFEEAVGFGCMRVGFESGFFKNLCLVLSLY